MTGVNKSSRRGHWSAPACTNLVDVFRWRAAERPDQIAFTFLGEDDVTIDTATYGQIDCRARAVAAELQRQTQPGDRALLVHGPGIEYAVALAGCLYAGVVAVPAYPPDPLRVARTLPRLEAIVRDAESRVVLGAASDLAWSGAMLGVMPGVTALIATNEIDSAGAENWQTPRLDRQSLAFLQYTSGSTGDPKGVMVRHGNVLHNLSQIEQTIDVDNAVAAMWLPPYHDMGLIGGILQCWYSGRHNVLMSPLAFFQRPLRWLQSIADYRATTTGAPNFAYELCVRKISAEERKTLDLSSWQLALCGAEPVRPQTIERFVETFAECGVRREIFRPCFGLAEATLMVTCSQNAHGPTIRAFNSELLAEKIAAEVPASSNSARVLAGCGPSVCDQEVRIVDPQTLVEQPAGAVGEIWVAGKNVAGGYWNRPAESQQIFQARTASGAGPFLRTGDAGFFHQGELFVSGRLKEMIIVHGRNYYPADLEQTVEACHEMLHGCCGAAFSYESDGRERVVLVQEVSRPKHADLEELARLARWALLEAHDVSLDNLVLVRRGTIPKTTSGKIQRSGCREQFLARSLDSLYCWKAPRVAEQLAERNYVPPRTPTEALLASAWEEVLGVPRVGVTENFIDLGGHSLLAAQLANRLGPRLGLQIPLSELFERPTVAALAELVDRLQAQKQCAEAELLDTLESMTDEEAQRLLSTVSFPLNALSHRDTTVS